MTYCNRYRMCGYRGYHERILQSEIWLMARRRLAHRLGSFQPEVGRCKHTLCAIRVPANLPTHSLVVGKEQGQEREEAGEGPFPAHDEACQ